MVLISLVISGALFGALGRLVLTGGGALEPRAGRARAPLSSARRTTAARAV